MPIDRNRLIWRIGVRMQLAANTHRSIGCPAVSAWGELLVALAAWDEAMLENNRDKFSEFMEEGD